MRLVQVADDGAVELNWMWLPTFIGQNHFILKELEHVWNAKFLGKLEPTEKGLDALHEFTLDWLQEKFKLPGLREYLSAIEKVPQ